MATHEHYLGQRLSFSSQLCTVRYVGIVARTKGEWLGVEWDDPRRGKHDGEHEGVRYFKCMFRLSNHLSGPSLITFTISQVSGGIPLLVPLYDRIDLQMNRGAFSKPCVRSMDPLAEP